MGITIGPSTPTPQAPGLLRGAARENLDLTLHGNKILTEGGGSPDVLINDEGAWRERISVHKCDAHGDEVVIAGVQQIYINDQRAVRIHDYLKGSGPLNPIVTGSPDVFMGDDPFGLTNNADFCKAFNELMAKWPTMTPAEREAGLSNLVGDMSRAQGQPPPTLTHNTGTYSNGNPKLAYFSFDRWEMNFPRNQNALYGGNPASTDIFSEPNLSDHEKCKFGETIVHELRHQTMAWNGLRKIAQNPSIIPSLSRFPGGTTLPPSVWTAAQSSPITAGSTDDTSGTNAVYDYFDNGFAADMANYRHSPGGSDAERHQHAVGCCSSGGK